MLVQKIPEFEYDPGKSFRGWLRTILFNKWRDRRRGAAVPLDAVEPGLLAAPHDAEVFGEAEYRQHLVERALEVMRAEFQPTTWKACWEHVVSGRSAAQVAAELGISEGAVYVAKCRVLRRLRQELKGLMD